MISANTKGQNALSENCRNSSFGLECTMTFSAIAVAATDVKLLKLHLITTFRASAYITANHPLEMITIDLTQMDMSSDGRDTVMVISDIFSKWAITVQVRDQTARIVVRVLVEEWFTVFGAPARIRSDQCRAFEADFISELREHYGIIKTRIDLYNLCWNG
ncbi:Pol polyprotein [Plakobranchus ocellatus]|uniref:Pol polyprotein n=1 Tax=Plakobranchus ocellatus TaxID=259542 RepID=A0AAV3YVE0_9GAST|nr:Pol polyprotein [Plakobranchus ocellatus]